MKFGLQVSSLKKFLQTPQDVLETFKKIKAIGYNYIQMQWVGDDVPMESVKESLDKSGLICIGIMDDDYFNSIDKIILKNTLWQGKYVCGGVNVPGEENEILEFAEKLNSVSRKLNEKGMIFEIHPVFPSYIVAGGIMPLDILWKHLDDNILLQPDFYHVVRGKANPVNLIEKYSGRIAEIHCKDFRIPDSSLDTAQSNNFNILQQGALPLTPVGQGVVPYRKIIEACIKQGVKYAWAEQEAWDKDPFECMKESFDFLIGCGLDA